MVKSPEEVVHMLEHVLLVVAAPVLIAVVHLLDRLHYRRFVRHLISGVAAAGGAPMTYAEVSELVEKMNGLQTYQLPRGRGAEVRKDDNARL